MKLYFDKEVDLNVSAQKAWSILANQYDCVGDWATIIPESSPRKENGELVGRTCSSTYGDVQEMITNWDEKNLTYSYEADGLPAMFKSGKNVWKIEPLGERKSKVKMTLRMEMKPLQGLLMGWMIKMKMGKDLEGFMQDLKYFAENGRPSPQKLKSLEKWNTYKAKKLAVA